MASRLPAKRKKERMKRYDRWTERERKFVKAYLRNGYRELDAWIEAGYSTKCSARNQAANARQILKRPKIKAYIEKRLAEHIMSSDEALARHSDVGRTDVGDCLVDHEVSCPKCGHVIEDAGTLRLDLNLMREKGKTHLIKKLTPFKDGRVAIELYEADVARRDLLKAHGAFRPTAEEQADGLLGLIAAASAVRDRQQNGNPAREEVDAEWSVDDDDFESNE